MPLHVAYMHPARLVVHWTHNEELSTQELPTTLLAFELSAIQRQVL